MNPQVRHAAMLSERVGDDTLVYVTETHTAHRLNSTAAAVWRLADGTRSVQELAATLCAEGIAGADDTLVLAALDELAEAGLAGVDPAPELERVSRREALTRAATVLLPLVASVIVPTPAEAQSGYTPQPSAPTPTPTSCQVSVSPMSASASALGGSGSVAVTTSTPTCLWTASSPPTWLTSTPLSGTGNGTVNWVASENLSIASRVGSLFVYGPTGSNSTGSCTVTQAAWPFTNANGNFRGSAQLRSPYGCGNFFVRSYSAGARVAIGADGMSGTITHESITGGYNRVYTIREVIILPDGGVKVICGVQDWVIGGVNFTGQLNAIIKGDTYQEEETLKRVDGSCTDIFDVTATRVVG